MVPLWGSYRGVPLAVPVITLVAVAGGRSRRRETPRASGAAETGETGSNGAAAHRRAAGMVFSIGNLAHLPALARDDTRVVGDVPSSRSKMHARTHTPHTEKYMHTHRTIPELLATSRWRRAEQQQV